MLMYPDHRQHWLDFGRLLLIFLILVAFWFSETGLISDFGAFSWERRGGMAWNIMLKYPDHFQDCFDLVHCLLIFVILVSFWLSETGQLWGSRRFSLERMGGMVQKFTCWCILTTFGTDYVLITVCWLSSFWLHSDLMRQVRFLVSGHFLENAWEECSEIWYPDHLRNWLNFGHGLWIFHIFVMEAPRSRANLTSPWREGGLVIFEEMKKANFSIWKLAIYRRGGWVGVIPNCCIVRLF